MQLILTNRMKMFVCLGCMVGYGLIYRAFLKGPLQRSIVDLPPDLQNLLILVTFSPAWVLGACAVGYYLKSQREKSKK